MSCKLCSDNGVYRGITGQENFCFCKAGRLAENEILFAPARIAQMGRPEQIAWLIRQNLEQYAARHRYKPTLQHLCGLASVALLVALKREGYSAYVAEGRVNFVYHLWVVHNRKIVDLTFTQFDSKAPRVLFDRLNNGRHEQQSMYRKPQRLATTMTEVRWQRDIAKIVEIDCAST